MTFGVNGDEITLKGKCAIKKSMNVKACSIVECDLGHDNDTSMCLFVVESNKETQHLQLKPPKKFKIFVLGDNQPSHVLFSTYLKPNEENKIIAWLKRHRGAIDKVRFDASKSVNLHNGKANQND